VCGPDEHCITCGDQAIPMRVVCTDPGSRLAWCRDTTGAGVAANVQVDVELVGDVEPGDLVLVHAGTALIRLSRLDGVIP
jgi:hydrogenase maturation factor